MGGTILQVRDKYAHLIAEVIRYTALLIPLPIIGYGLLAHWELVPLSPLYSPLALAIVVGFSVTLALWQFLNRPYTTNRVFITVILYHLLGTAVVLLVSGFISPLTLLWILLVVVANLTYALRGLVYSLASLFAVAFASLSLLPLDTTSLSLHFAYIVAIAAVALFIDRLRWVESIEHDDFMKSKERQTLQQSQLLTLINSVNEAIISTNARGTVQIYNAATLSLLDTNQSLAGKRLSDIFNTYDEEGDPINLFATLSRNLRTQQRDDLEHRFADGEAIKLGISSAAIRSNQPARHNKIEGYILIVRDITKSKSLEEERDEFISVVSHELRTPITIAEGTISNLELLMKQGTSPKKLSEPVKDAHEQIVYLSKMVNDLSTLSRAERGVADTPEVINVTELMNDLYTQYSQKAQKKDLTFNLDTQGKLGSVLASRLYLEEVLQNFIVNAIKYTPKGSVTISARRIGKKVNFAIKDSGIGIGKREQKRVFDKFYRSEDYRTRETSGTGLGLYVVKKLATKLGVNVEVDSRLNHGSTFSFSLPVYTPTVDDSPKKS